MFLYIRICVCVFFYVCSCAFLCLYKLNELMWTEIFWIFFLHYLILIYFFFCTAFRITRITYTNQTFTLHIYTHTRAHTRTCVHLRMCLGTCNDTFASSVWQWSYKCNCHTWKTVNFAAETILHKFLLFKFNFLFYFSILINFY